MKNEFLNPLVFGFRDKEKNIYIIIYFHANPIHVYKILFVVLFACLALDFVKVLFCKKKNGVLTALGLGFTVRKSQISHKKTQIGRERGQEERHRKRTGVREMKKGKR